MMNEDVTRLILPPTLTVETTRLAQAIFRINGKARCSIPDSNNNWHKIISTFFRYAFWNAFIRCPAAIIIILFAPEVFEDFNA